VLMPMEVIVATAVHRSRIEYRESFILTTMPALRHCRNV
jgi:hypothetical protein